MKTSGTLLQFLSVAIGIFGTLAGVVTFLSSSYGFGLGLLTIFISIVLWVLLYGVGAAFLRLEGMAVDMRRSADALDVLVKHQTGVGSLPPDPLPTKSTTIRSLIQPKQ